MKAECNQRAAKSMTNEIHQKHVMKDNLNLRKKNELNVMTARLS